jgi:hypothetical protein
MCASSKSGTLDIRSLITYNIKATKQNNVSDSKVQKRC